MGLESPQQLMGRLKLGREEFCQRLLTMLILNGPYPRWNSRSTPSPEGMSFLRELHRRSFDDPWPGDNAVFVDEFELRARHDDEPGGAPDYGVLWDDHLWLIELKTERASHREGQIGGYFELARHHYPLADVDLLYVTPAMVAPFEPEGLGFRYAHTTWEDLAPLVRATWGASPDEGRRELLVGLVDTIGGLELKPSEWRLKALQGASVTPKPSAAAPGAAEELVERAMEAALLTGEDKVQRAVEFQPTDLQELLDLRANVRGRLASTSPDSPLRHVMPWIWQWLSTGKPLSSGGQEVGMELRLSWYKRQLY